MAIPLAELLVSPFAFRYCCAEWQPLMLHPQSMPSCRHLTRSDASLTLVPNPKAGSEGLVLLTWDPNPLRSILVLESGCFMALRPLSILTSPTNYKITGKLKTTE